MSEGITAGTVVCRECGRTKQHPADDGMPFGWIALPMARPGEPVVYTSHNGHEYTSAALIGNLAVWGRYHAALCPECSEPDEEEEL